jgi:hypothetical protein
VVSQTFTINPDGCAVMRFRGHNYPMRPITVRPRKYVINCGLCRRTIITGTAYVETGEAKNRYFLSGVKVCEKCVKGEVGCG